MRGSVGGGEELAHEHQELKARLLEVLRRGRDRPAVGFPRRTEAAAERSSTVRGFPARKVAKFWSSSYSSVTPDL
jgi:hypothetical protein